MKAQIGIKSPGSDTVYYEHEGNLAEIKREAKRIACSHIEPAIAILFGDALHFSVDLRAYSPRDHFYWCVYGNRVDAETARIFEGQLHGTKGELR